MLHASDEAEYLNEVCQNICDCGHTMAWIGLAEDDDAKSVRPVAHAGFEDGYLETLHLSWADTERGRGPAGAAIRTGVPMLCRNILTDPNFAPWRDEALKRKYAAALVLPLTDAGKTFGVLAIYARQADAFPPEEEQLLGELAADLAHGITGLRAAAARKLAEARLRRFYEAELFAVLYWKIDGGVIDVNDQFLKLTGYSRDDVRAGRVNWAEITPPEYQALEEDARRQILETGVHRPYEKEFICKDGSRVWGLVSAAAYEDDRTQGVSFILDVTERKRTEKALHASEERYRLLFDRNPDGVFALDHTGRFLVANPACVTMSGYSLAELLQMTFMQLCAPDQFATTTAEFQRLMREPGYSELETDLIRKDGRRIQAWIAGEAVVSGGKATGVHGTVKDITERNYAEALIQQQIEELRVANEDLARFNRVAVGRELRMVGLKKEVNTLCVLAGQPPRYALDFEKDLVASVLRPMAPRTIDHPYAP